MPAKSKRKGAANVHDEERDLEARLFGSRQPVKRSRKDPAVGSDDEEDTGLGWMQDDQLFTVDIPQFENEDSDAAGDISEDELEPTIEFPQVEAEWRPAAASSGSAPLWEDPADSMMQTALKSNKKTRKLARVKNAQDVVSGSELQAKLREQFEVLHPKPEWASRRVEGAMPTLQKLLSSTTSFISPSSGPNRGPLAQTFIDIQRMRNANEQNATVGKNQASNAGQGVVDFSWHPSQRVSVMAVAGGDRRVRFFNIDGHNNAPLLTLHIPSLPLNKATFHPSGSSILLTGTRPFYYTYDMAAQRCIRSPRNLFGSVPTPTSPQSLGRHAFSPDGSLLAVAGRRGAVSVLEWSQGGSTGVVVAELRSGRGGTVADMAWSEDGRELSVLGGRTGSDVEVWDVAERQVSRQWKDDRAFGGLLLRQSSSNYTAIGSSTGIVNLYHSNSLPTKKGIHAAEPFKSLEHLTTPISAMAFHPSGELFASASSAKKDAFRLYHLPSGTAFSNWPTPATPLGRVSSVGFSASGEYLATGNTKGAVLLWSLKHFAE